MKPALFELDPGGFQFGVVVEGVYGFIPSVTALLEAAKGRGHVDGVVAVPKDHAGLEAGRHVVALDNVAGEHAGVEVGRAMGTPKRAQVHAALAAIH